MPFVSHSPHFVRNVAISESCKPVLYKLSEPMVDLIGRVDRGVQMKPIGIEHFLKAFAVDGVTAIVVIVIIVA